jgi:hypothetical protein
VASIQVSNGPVSGGDVAVGGGSVWARVTDELAIRIDPAAWIAAHDSQTAWRLPPS